MTKEELEELREECYEFLSGTDNVSANDMLRLLDEIERLKKALDQAIDWVWTLNTSRRGDAPERYSELAAYLKENG